MNMRARSVVPRFRKARKLGQPISVTLWRNFKWASHKTLRLPRPLFRFFRRLLFVFVLIVLILRDCDRDRLLRDCYIQWLAAPRISRPPRCGYAYGQNTTVAGKFDSCDDYTLCRRLRLHGFCVERETYPEQRDGDNSQYNLEIEIWFQHTILQAGNHTRFVDLWAGGQSYSRSLQLGWVF